MKKEYTYHFISKEEFEERIKNGEFYEYDLHHNNYYGTSRKLLNEKIARWKNNSKRYRSKWNRKFIKTY